MFKNILLDLISETCGTQKNLSILTKIPATTISNWIVRGSLPTLEQLIILSKFFNVTIDYLAGIEKDIGLINNKEENLSKDKQEILQIYDALSEAEKMTAVQMMHVLGKKVLPKIKETEIKM